MRGLLATILFFALTVAPAASVAGGFLPPPGDSGDSGGFDSGDTGAIDTGAPTDTGSTDTGPDGEDTAGPVYSAAQRAGEKGGFGCSSAGAMGSAVLMWSGVLLVAGRRRDD